ncbi:uroporphyrinogen-III synthase [Cellvibrio japonicus]|nr:uroporphyrinogen-III synthase [Cellvibrio japonicus]QEI17884.1 uroporphyrinogen-III synthase [Cellvibrio japonicus]QEI21460.1 uroporphyrinogen-III synthase [Cellvibrio japonicus]
MITRPQAQAEPWAKQLQAQGFATRLLTLLEIMPLKDETRQRAIQNRVMDFDLYQKAIFVSQNAVHQAMDWLDRYWPQLPIGIEYFAVGATTARELAVHGIPVTDLAQAESGSMTSEALLEAASLQQVAGEKVIIFRGLGGRGHMGDVLRARGAQVDYCELYERCLPSHAATGLHQLLADITCWQARQQVMALHSGESLQHLLQLLELPLLSPLRGRLQRAWLLVPSERIRDQAQTAGFHRCLLAENATDAAMTQALVAARAAAVSLNDC